MKKTKIVAIIAGIVVIVGVLVGVSVWQGKNAPKMAESAEVARDFAKNGYLRAELKERAEALEGDYDAFEIHEASKESGGIADHIRGDINKAKVVLFEFADYQCSHCAEWNKVINELLETYKEKVALVYRSYSLSYNTNSVMVASAVEAAGLQGYWLEYKDYVFENQADWYYDKHETLQGRLEKYFMLVTDGKGDLEKFRKDMMSEEVAAKLAYDMKLADTVELQGTPAFYMDGKLVALADLIKTVQEKL